MGKHFPHDTRRATTAKAALALAAAVGLVGGGMVIASASTKTPAAYYFCIDSRNAPVKAYPVDGWHGNRCPSGDVMYRVPSVDGMRQAIGANPTPSSTPTTVPPTTVPPTTAAPTTTAPPSNPSTSDSPTASPTTSPAAFPDASNTGVPAGVTLKQVPQDVTSGTGWHWDTRGWVVIDGAGATFTGYEVHASVNIQAANVTVKNNRIIDTGNDIAVAIRHVNGATVDHNTISGATNGGPDDNRLTIAIKDVYGDAADITATGNNIFDASAGITFDDGVIADNYIHDFGYNPADHVDGIQSFGTGTLLTIRHNTILNGLQQTACVLISNTEDSHQGNKLIEDNLFAGGGYSIYGGHDNSAGPSSNIRIIDNAFSTRFFPHGGYWGIDAYFTVGDPGNAWFGNYWYETGDAIPTP